MTLGGAMHQKSGKLQGRPERTLAGRGEAASEAVSVSLSEISCVRHSSSSGGAARRCTASCASWVRARMQRHARIAGNARSWWRNSRMGLNKVLPITYFDRLGVPKFS